MKVSIIWISVLLSLCCTAQDSALQLALQEFSSKDHLTHSSIGISIIELKTGHMIGSFQEQKSLVPASSLKLLTTLSAIYYLGEDFRYQTTLAHSGSVFTDGTLEGNIYLIGSGDPSLGSEKMGDYKGVLQLSKKISSDIREYGISCIAGDIVADESVFNSFPISPSWQWNDLGNYYASGAWGVNVNDNLYRIYFAQQPKEGMVPKLRRYQPYIPKLELQNEVESGPKGSGDNAYIFGGPYNYTKRIVGTIPPGTGEFSIKGSIPDPPLFMAYHLQHALHNSEIFSDDYKAIHMFDERSTSRQIIKVYRSPALKKLVHHTNNKSDNLYAEAILKTLGHGYQQKGSGSSGIAAIKQYLTDQDISISGLRMDDGSGLSARNRITAKLMSKFLASTAAELGLQKVCSYLPKGGEEGTVASLFKESPVKGRIFLKSGSMEGIMSYSGFLKSKSGKWHSFCIIVNGYEVPNRRMRQHLESLMTLIYNKT